MNTIVSPVFRAATARAPVSAASLFSHTICIACLILQRFGWSQSRFSFTAALIIVPLGLAWIVLSRKARVEPILTVLYSLMLACFLSSVLGALLFPDLTMRFSVLSIAELLILYTAFILSPAQDFDRKIVLDVFIFYARICACAGLLQFALQFAHIRLFSFATLVPALRPVLTEAGFNVAAPLTYGSPIFRSNGFFLEEPSIFSQIMALAVVIDYFMRHKLVFLPVYFLGMLSSYSGTGFLALAVTLFVVGLLSPSQIHRTVLIGAVGLIVTVGYALAFPAQFATLAARAGGNDASAHARYGLQLEALRALLATPRGVFGFGPGAADGFAPPGSMSVPLKVLFDYGVTGSVTFVAFLLAAIWRSKPPVVPIMCLAIFSLGGGYLLWPPMVYLIALICIWGPKTPAAQPRAAPMRSLVRPPILAP